MTSSPGNRLDSWKEIAQYLGRYERTVQRWELERNLPIHRLPGTKRGGVFAYTAELDAWLAQAAGLEEHESEEQEHTGKFETTEFVVESKPSGVDAPSLPVPDAHVATPPVSRFRSTLLLTGIAGLVLLACVVLIYIGLHRSTATAFAGKSVQMQQLTFRRGSVRAARFRPDGQNVVYGATWEDSTAQELFETSLDRPESSALRSPGAQLLAVSRSSTLAILLDPQFIGTFIQFGTLAVQGLYEDKPLVISQHVSWADWSADGSTLYYVIHDRQENSWLEAYSQNTHQTHRVYPATSIPAQWYSHLRVSPKGDMLAFEQHDGMENGGKVVILSLSGGSPRVSRHFASIDGLAWPPQQKEVWFTAAEEGLLRGIYAMGSSGVERMVYQAPVALTLQDISRNGDVLATRDLDSSDVFARKQGVGTKEVDLSLFDWSSLGDISDDGKRVALFETGDAHRKPGVYLRDITGGSSTAMGEALAPVSFSPSGNSLLALSNESCPRVVHLSLEQRPQILTRTNLCVNRAIWTPDGHRMIFEAAEPGHKIRCFLQSMGGTDAHPISAEDTHCPLISPDGKYALVQSGEEFSKVAMDGSKPPVKIKLPSSGAPIRPIRWLADNRIVANNGTAQPLVTIDLTTGRTSFIPVDMPARWKNIFAIKVSADLKVISYSGYALRSDLFLIRGLQ